MMVRTYLLLVKRFLAKYQNKFYLNPRFSPNIYRFRHLFICVFHTLVVWETLWAGVRVKVETLELVQNIGLDYKWE